MPTRRSTRAYDHRLVRLVEESRDPSTAVRAGFPQSAAAGWLRQRPRPSAAGLDADEPVDRLRARVAGLEGRVRHLYSLARVRRLVEFHVTEHGARLAHSAFRGQPPDGMHFGTGDGVPDRLAAARAEARRAHRRPTERRPAPSVPDP